MITVWGERGSQLTAKIAGPHRTFDDATGNNVLARSRHLVAVAGVD